MANNASNITYEQWYNFNFKSGMLCNIEYIRFRVYPTEDIEDTTACVLDSCLKVDKALYMFGDYKVIMFGIDDRSRVKDTFCICITK